MKSFVSVIGLVLVSLSLVSCDLVKQAVDREGEAFRENTNKEEASLAPLAGEYRGTLRSGSDEPKQIKLVLVPNMLVVQNPGRNDITLYPTLGGTMSVVLPPLESAPGSPVVVGEDVIPIASYTMAKYDALSGKLKLSGTMMVPSAGSIMVSLDATFKPAGQSEVTQPARIEGYAQSSLKGTVGFVELERVSAK